MLLGHSVVGLTRNGSAHAASWPLVDVDYSSDDSISRALDGVDAVVHCAIADDFRRLLNDRAAAYDNYVALTERLARIADANGQKFIFISTDWVMDGTGHRELESNHGNAIN
jgi:dTDP-4-dehydrorhamnose reductase